MLAFPEEWGIRPPRSWTVDPSTGNRRPGQRPDAVPVRASLEQRFPANEQKSIRNDVVSDERILLLHPGADRKVGGITNEHQAIAPDGTVWSIVLEPNPRRRRRFGAPTRYIALVIRRATDIKEK
ncbi:hypothetical protein [Gordonia malaquae]|uniref:hypothetical protein n=1 Tax=Gordonia malaquae TaxID=410332 RepID=UPI00301A8C73